MLESRLLGQFDLRVDGKPIAVPSRAAQSLLAYLLLHPGSPHRRERLAGLLWPDISDENARRNLRQELWRLRKVLEPTGAIYLQADDLTVALNANAGLWLDVAVLESAGLSDSSDDLAHALDGYRGELLPGFYDEWVVLERERLRAVYERQMQRLIERLTDVGDWSGVLTRGEKWVAQGTSPEPAYRALMMAHAAQGDMSKVAATYERCVAALRHDLGVEPSEQTRALYERLRAGEPVSPRTLAAMPRQALVGMMSVADESPAPGEPPFKGLHYFDEADAGLFFGREQLTAKLVAQLQAQPLLLVIGASGSGKSSLVRAGLIPAVKRLEAPGKRNWIVHVCTPTAHPLEALALTLTRNLQTTAATTALMDEMARDPRSLRIYCRKLLTAAHSSGEPENRLLLVVDQFEELFTLCRDEAERRACVDNLLGLVEPEGDGAARLVVTLRADFYAHCAPYARLREVLETSQAYLGPMSADELRRAIEGPARHGDWHVEPGLTDLILRDLGDEPGALPLLSHALYETWRRRRGRTLAFAGYAACGGVRGAVAHSAEFVFNQFDAEQQAIARNIFLRLTELGEGTQDTRRRATLSELVPPYVDAQAAEAVLKRLADARLVTTGEGYAEVAHEALIREWSRLREWLSQDREGLRLHRHLTEAAQAWQKLSRDEGELYRGARLAQASEWAREHGADLNPLEREFIAASQALLEREEAEREAQRQRELEAAQKLAEAERQRAEVQTNAAQKLRQRALLLAGALVLVALLAASSALFAQQATASAERAETERRIAFVRELSLSAVSNLEADPERSILLALQSVRMSTTDGKPVLREAEEALHRAVITSRVVLTMRGHKSSVVGIALSPDGQRLASASFDKTAKIWDAATGQELLALVGHTAEVRGVIYSPDGKRLATASNDKTAKVWDATTGRELLTLTGHTGAINGVAFSPDGRRLATSSALAGGADTLDHTAIVWDATSGKKLLTLIGHTGSIPAVAFSPDGTQLATGSVDKTAKIWDAATGKPLLTLAGHAVLVQSVSFSPDGKRLATGGGDGTVKVWDAATGQALFTILAHSNTVGSIAFDSSGTRMVTASSDGMAKIWDAAIGQMLLPLAGHSANVNDVVFSLDGRRVATAGGDTTVRVWDVSVAGSREWLTLENHRGPVRSVAYSPDGRRIASASEDHTARVWDARTGEELLSLVGHTDELRDIIFSPDGSNLVTTSNDQNIRVWDATTGKETLTIPAQTYSAGGGPGQHVAVSPDGQRIAAPGPGDIQTTSGTGVLKLWDMKSGKELLTFSGHRGAVFGVAFSPDGKRLATASTDYTARVWDAETGKELLTLVGHSTAVFDVSFSPDGRRLATASNDGTAKVWDAATGQLLLTLSGHTGGLRTSIFSPDGTRLSTTSLDGTIKVWDVSLASGRSEPPLTLYGRSGRIWRAMFSPDGKRLVTGGDDGIVRVWALAIEDIVAIAKTRVTRTLTQDECQKYLHVETCPPGP